MFPASLRTAWYIDSEHVKNVPEVKAKVLKYAISQRARELGREIVANIVALGLLVGITKIVPEEAALSAVLQGCRREQRT